MNQSSTSSWKFAASNVSSILVQIISSHIGNSDDDDDGGYDDDVDDDENWDVCHKRF